MFNSFSFFNMTEKFYSYSSSTVYSNINGKESFEKVEVENNNGKKKVKRIATNDKDGQTKGQKIKSKIKKLLLS